MNVVLNRTVVVHSDWRFDNLCGSHLQSQGELYHVSWWYYTLVINTVNWRDTTHFDSEDDYRTGCENVSHCEQQRPIQDYVHADDQTHCILYTQRLLL